MDFLEILASYAFIFGNKSETPAYLFVLQKLTSIPLVSIFPTSFPFRN